MAGFRTIVINKRCKLESQLGAMVIRSEGEERVHIAEIETLIIESAAVSLTSSLVADLTTAGANIIFCDRKSLPTAVFTPVHAHFSSAKNIKEQIAWNDERKAECWGLIIKDKIRRQASLLLMHNRFDEHALLNEYAEKVNNGNTENYEARAAAVYFRALFGNSFSRNEVCFENDALNYGYTLIMATFAREITACGYLTELGIWHRSAENAFNEDFRIHSGLNVEYDTVMNAVNLAKVCSLKIADDKAPLIERLAEYVNLLCDLKPLKLFALIFGKEFLDERDISEFRRHCHNKQVRLLLVEGEDKTSLMDNERRLIIDKDLCAIPLGYC